MFSNSEERMLRAFARACAEGQATAFVTSHTTTPGQDVVHAISKKEDVALCGAVGKRTIVSRQFAMVNCDGCMQMIMEGT